MCTHAPGRRSAASARTNNTKHVPERADHELFGSYLTKSLLRVPEFRWVAAFRGVYEHPTHLTSDDDAPTTRKKKSASQATVRADPPAKRVGGGHGGAVVLVARARSFVWCVTPRGAGAFKSQVVRCPARGLLQKTQTSKLPNLAAVARTLFWSFCAG